MKKAIREAIVMAVIFGGLVGALFLYAGTWPPAVIVESGSMMHADENVSYGRLRTIDPGDLVVVKDVDALDDVTTQVEGGRARYGKPGDVIVYYPANDRGRTPIIHRAVAYVEVLPGPVYDVRWSDGPCEAGAQKLERGGHAWCRYGSEGILVPGAEVWVRPGGGEPRPYRPPSTGFLTKGDNPVTNTQLDQLAHISLDARGEAVPVPLDWLAGKGRGELPWLGLLKLAIAPEPNEDSPPRAWVQLGNAYAPKDLWVMLAISLVALVGGPFVVDGVQALRARRRSP